LEVGAELALVGTVNDDVGGAAVAGLDSDFGIGFESFGDASAEDSLKDGAVSVDRYPGGGRANFEINLQTAGLSGRGGGRSGGAGSGDGGSGGR